MARRSKPCVSPAFRRLTRRLCACVLNAATALAPNENVEANAAQVATQCVSRRADQRSRACFRRRRSRVPAAQLEGNWYWVLDGELDSDGAISPRARCGHGGFASEPTTPTVKRWPASSVSSLGGPRPITVACAHPLRPVLPSRPSHGSSSIGCHDDARRSGDFKQSAVGRVSPAPLNGPWECDNDTGSGSVSTCVFATATRSTPVATTDTRTTPSREGSKVAPRMMLVSSSTSWRIRSPLRPGQTSSDRRL